jgi:hypothetical protein
MVALYLDGMKTAAYATMVMGNTAKGGTRLCIWDWMST